jgi:two-component system response regulator HydG
MNAVERAVILARSDYLNEEDLSLVSQKEPSRGETRQTHTSPSGVPLEAVERDAILRTLDAAGGNKSEAARRLGITRRTLHKKLKRYGLMA